MGLYLSDLLINFSYGTEILDFRDLPTIKGLVPQNVFFILTAPPSFYSSWGLLTKLALNQQDVKTVRGINYNVTDKLRPNRKHHRSSVCMETEAKTRVNEALLVCCYKSEIYFCLLFLIAMFSDLFFVS